MYKKILVATDGSTLSKKAVRGAIGLAAATGGSVVALYVVPRYPVSYFEGSITLDSTEISRVEKQWTDKGREVVERAQREAEAAGVQLKAVTAQSDLVAEAIVSAAKKHKCDLITMASHGRKGIKRLLLGSETQHVLANSTVPVLVLR
ncbi:universal stress protein [Caenimonas sp. SL110]|uniref:universal stress protein n=1 Tax=Caenimonas sp. SL110 TaxID=1450524 RepID=UPI0006538F2B|nr:universal stress protein [Caenimonas sp. SL110]